MQTSWWSSGGALFIAVAGALGACSNRPDELVREPQPAQAPGARVPDSLARQADSEVLKKALKERLSRSGKDLPTEKTAAGTTRIDLRGRFRSAHVATIDENGKKRVDCVTSNRELDAVLEKGGRR